MDAAISLVVVCAVAALLKWKLRRTFAARRVSRGLRVYAEGRQVAS